MAIVMIMKWPGVTKEQYEEARKQVQWETNMPQGALFHIAAFDDKGLRVVDLWDSADEFQSFVEKRLQPATEKIGIQGDPNVEIFPVHALFTPGYKQA